MTPSFYARLITSWNQDPLMANVVRGRTLVAQEAAEGLIVSWREGEKIRVYPLPYSRISAGWSDALTDLLELLQRPGSLDRVEGEPR